MKTVSLLAATLLCVLDARAAAYRIEHLEPLSWWIGMDDRRLQLMVHGERIAELEPSIAYPGVTIEGVRRTDNPNYLFIDLTVGETTRPGRVRIAFRRDGRQVLAHDYPLNAREPGSASRRGFGPADVIYLVTPDRFANGDAANDRIGGYRESPDRSLPLGRHGGDLRGLIARLDYIAGMGFTQLWLNPVLENDQPHASYHGYAITDFYRVDPRFGNNELYRALSREARAREVGLIMDVVLNHCGSEHWWMRDLPSRDWINFDGQFVPTNHSKESLHDPHGAAVDRQRFTDGWFVPTMPDLNQRNSLLATYLIQNSLWWIEYAGLSGLRVDTWSYSDRGFLTEWTRRVTEEYPQLNIVAEEWVARPALIAYWQRGGRPHDGYRSYLPALFDFPLQTAIVAGLTEEEGWDTGLTRIYRLLADDFLYPDPYALVTFADNHDMSRLFTQVGEDADLHRMALAILLTMRGTPQVYYGTEVLLANPGTEDHGVIRADFPGGWAGDPANGFTGAGLTARQRDAQAWLRRLLAWRKGSPAVHAGTLTHYAPQEGTYVYFRRAEAQQILVAVNKTQEARSLDVARFRESIGPHTAATDVLSGERRAIGDTLQLPARSVSIFELHVGQEAER